MSEPEIKVGQFGRGRLLLEGNHYVYGYVMSVFSGVISMAHLGPTHANVSHVNQGIAYSACEIAVSMFIGDVDKDSFQPVELREQPYSTLPYDVHIGGLDKEKETRPKGIDPIHEALANLTILMHRHGVPNELRDAYQAAKEALGWEGLILTGQLMRPYQQ